MFILLNFFKQILYQFLQESQLEPTRQPLLPLEAGNQVVKPLTRTDSLIMLKTCAPHNTRHYLKNIKLHKHSVMYRGAMLNIPRYRLRASSCPNIFRNSMTTLARENEQVSSKRRWAKLKFT